VFRPEVTEEFGRRGRYFNTFGGSSVPIAAANAVLDVLIEERLPERAREVGAALREGVRTLLAPYPQVVDVRGAGYFIGVEFVDVDGEPDAAGAANLVNELRRRRVLISASGPAGNVLKIRPPMAFCFADADRFLAALDASATDVLR
jgi:4-aminobutyrate aminotransferase-like enzyme